MTGDPLLSVEQVSVRFGANVVLDGIDLAVDEGEVVGLIGPNGAGKTTLFNVITGLQGATRGRIRFDGADLGRTDVQRRARRGIGRTFQRLELFTDLTVRDNLRVAGEVRNRWGLLGWARPGLDVSTETERLLDVLNLREFAEAEAAEVPTGVARRVELGRALMLRPRVLLLDEPASGQTDAETESFAQLLRHLAVGEGTAILLVEHDMALVMGVCDRVAVLDVGRMIASGRPSVVRADPAVLEAYLGAPG